MRDCPPLTSGLKNGCHHYWLVDLWMIWQDHRVQSQIINQPLLAEGGVYQAQRDQFVVWETRPSASIVDCIVTRSFGHSVIYMLCSFSFVMVIFCHLLANYE